MLWPTPVGFAAVRQPLRAGLRDLGHVEGQNLVIEFRWAPYHCVLQHDAPAAGETIHGPWGIVLNRTGQAAKPGAPLKILVPTAGTPAAGLAIEMALALVRASNGALTVLHVFDPQDDTALLRGRARRQGLSLLAEARRLGECTDVPVNAIYVTHAMPEAAIQRSARAGRYDLVVVGTSLREGATKFLGPRSSALLRTLDSPTLLVTQ